MKNLAVLGSLLVLLFVAGCSVATNFGGANRDFIRTSEGDVLSRSLGSSRIVSVDNRTNCAVGDQDPVSRVNTTTRVAALISELETRGYAAYIITTGDEHQSEYPPDHDRRREYISGFSGSAGTAVVLASGERALWTDGRYFLQADDQLDCQWLLMKDGLEGYPDILEFLLDNLASGDVVSADAKLIAYGSWNELSEGLAGNGITIEGSTDNLVDIVWTLDPDNVQPGYPTTPAIVYPVEYAGQSYEEKLSDMRDVLAEEGAGALVVTALDEVAWLYNIRGEDVRYNPVLRSYAIVTTTGATLYADLAKIPQEVIDQLSDVTIAEYEQVWDDLAALSADDTISKIFLPGDDRTTGCSFAIYNTVAAEKRLVETTPTLINKARKNSIEISQMREAIITDGVALSRFLAFLEAEITAGNEWTEVSAQERLTEYRMFHGARDLSFGTISGYGPHGAVIHYEATNDTDVVIGTSSLYLLDSGGQYFGATTDVTRTMHYGEPTAEEIEMYTRVLMGNIDFGALVFPRGTLKTRMDVLARRPIWSEGLDYRHGTSHGIGMYLNVHEPYLDAFDLGYVCSDEPGYYKDGEYGIRIEDQVTVIDAGLFFDEPYYKIDMMTMVPYEPKLIDVSIMTDEQVAVLNERNAQTRATVGALLLDQGYITEYEWLMDKTEPLVKTA